MGSLSTSSTCISFCIFALSSRFAVLTLALLCCILLHVFDYGRARARCSSVHVRQRSSRCVGGAFLPAARAGVVPESSGIFHLRDFRLWIVFLRSIRGDELCQ